jgi:hypothetical protein
VEPKETYIARQRIGKHVPAATNTQITMAESFETVFSVGSALRLYNEDPTPAAETQTHRPQGDLISVKTEGINRQKRHGYKDSKVILLASCDFFQNKESRLKIELR